MPYAGKSDDAGDNPQNITGGGTVLLPLPTLHLLWKCARQCEVGVRAHVS